MTKIDYDQCDGTFSAVLLLWQSLCQEQKMFIRMHVELTAGFTYTKDLSEIPIRNKQSQMQFNSIIISQLTNFDFQAENVKKSLFGRIVRIHFTSGSA